MKHTKLYIILCMVFLLSYGIAKSRKTVDTESTAEVKDQLTSSTEIARAAAQHGMSHFITIHLSESTVHQGIVVPETRLSGDLTYEVSATTTNDGKITVTSSGKYKDASGNIIKYPIRTTIDPR